MFETLHERLKGRDTGFTLIEVVVVIVIVGILGAIGLPLYLNIQERASASAAAEKLRALVRSIDAYRSDHGTYARMTITGLRSSYDRSIDPSVYTLSSLGSTAYCAKATVGGVTAYKSGPSAPVLTSGTPCG
jgi:type IV pilus assembly protein PilA